MLAKRRGPCLPQDMLMAFRAADRDRNEIEFDEEKMTKWQKLSLFQRLYSHVVCGVVQAIREQMQRELMGAKGFVACLVKTDKSSKFYTKDPGTGKVKEQFILIKRKLFFPGQCSRCQSYGQRSSCCA